MAFERYLPPVEQSPDDPMISPRKTGSIRVCADDPAETPLQTVTPLPPEDFCGSRGDSEVLHRTSCNGSKTPKNPSISAKGNEVTGRNGGKAGPAAHASNGSRDGPSISAISGDQGETKPTRGGRPNGALNGATDHDYTPTSVEEGARHFMAANPGWSLSRIAKELAVPTSFIEELFPERAATESPIVKKVRSALAEHPDWSPDQISKHIKRAKSAVNRALRIIGQ